MIKIYKYQASIEKATKVATQRSWGETKRKLKPIETHMLARTQICLNINSKRIEAYSNFEYLKDYLRSKSLGRPTDLLRVNETQE